MDFDDTPEEAAFRAEARAWLDGQRHPEGKPGGLLRRALRRRPRPRRVRQALPVVAGPAARGRAGPASPGRRRSAGAAASPIEEAIFAEEQAKWGVSVGVFAVAIGMVAPTLMQHGTPEQQERWLDADAPRRRDVVPAVQRARGRLRPGVAAHARRARRRRVGRRRAEGVDVERAARRVGHPHRPHRSRRRQARRHHLLRRRHGHARASTSGRCASSTARPTSTRCSSTACASRRPGDRRGRRRLEGRGHDAVERAGGHRRRLGHERSRPAARCWPPSSASAPTRCSGSASPSVDPQRSCCAT